MKPSILILGGTTEARGLAKRLSADGRYDCLLSLAGRTLNPLAQPVPVRSGGFGGAEGLADFLRQGCFDLLVDATHPYAARISANAAMAASMAGVPLVALRRPPWQREEGDLWQEVASVAEAVAATGTEPQRIFLTLGRQELLPFEAAPQHFYLVRSVDPVEPPLALPQVDYITDIGPFALEAERELLTRHAIGLIVSKNSGGSASHAKIVAARQLRIPVLVIGRPVLPDAPSAPDIDTALAMIAHELSPSRKRGE